MKNIILVAGALALALTGACSSTNTPNTGQSQLENYVINGVRRIDRNIELPPLTPEQAGQIKFIIDQSRREATDWEKSQQVKAYLRRIS